MTRCRGILLCIFVSLYVLCQFRFIDGRTTAATTKAPLSRTTATKKTNNTKAANKLPARTGGQIITLRFGNDGNIPEEQCECKLFYLCNQENTVDITINQIGQKCSENNLVCCKVEMEVENPNPIITPAPPDDPSTNGFVDPVEPEVTPSPSPSEDCRCVPIEQCQKTNEDGNILTRRTNTCDISEYCCSEENIIPTRPTDPPPVVSPSTDTPIYDCGLKNAGIEIFNRIVSPNHLKNTTFGEFPWMALLLTAEIDPSTGQRLDNVFVCGASLISSKIVLTAGHCVHDVSNVNLLKVRVGEYDTRAEANKEQKPHQDRQVLKITQHPQFNSKSLFNDLALLEVVEPFVFDYHIRPICIPLISNDYDYDPSNCVATGWGKNAFGPDSEYPTTLKKVDLTIVPNDKCQEELRKTRLGQYFRLDPSFICAGGQPGMDTCEGDGGGPLVCHVRDTLNKYVQVGIVSWGIGCGNGLPAAYAKLEKNVEWLTQEFNAATVFSSSSIGDKGRR